MSGGSRVSIPNSVRRMILDIKEIAGKHSEDDIYTMLRDCNMDPNETAQKLLYIDTFHEVKKKRGKNMGGRFEENRWAGGMNRRGGRSGYSSTVNGVNNRTQKGFNKPPMPVLTKTENGATPQPSISPAVVASDGPVNVVSEGSGHRAVAKQSAVGVKHDHVNKNIGAESNATGVEGNKSTIGQDAAKTSPASSVAANSTSRESSVKANGVVESEKSSLPSENASQIISSKPATQSPQPIDVPKEPLAQSAVMDDSVSKEVTPEVTEKTTQQSVIFPQHLHVPEPYKSQLTFGSLDSVFNPKDSVPVIESFHIDTVALKEPCLSETVSPATADDNLSESQQNLAHVLETNSKTLEENNASLGPASHWIPPLIVPPLIESHLVQIEEQEPETHSGAKSPGQTTSASTPTGAQAAAAQSPITVTAPPHLFPYFQHPYPPNYFPYNPYYPHVVFSQNGHHQFLGHNGYPQQPSTGNVYMPQPTVTAAAAAAAAATPAGKLAVTPQYKLGPTTVGNLTPHLGIPYATYGGVGSAVSYNPNVPAVMSGSSASTEEIAASDRKEKSNYSALPQQGEESRAWSPVTGREIPNYYYNLPHTQHVTFSPAQGGHGSYAGLYHPSQATVTPPAVRSLIHQSHATAAGQVENVVPTPSPYQQHPRIAQVNWNTPILNRENM